MQRQGEEELYKPGDVIGGKYKVHRRLAKGGFGTVYLVYKQKTGNVCALKTFRDEYLVDAAARKMFKKEALLWVNLEEHPFILAARWVNEFCSRLFVEMDYIAADPQGRVKLTISLITPRISSLKSFLCSAAFDLYSSQKPMLSLIRAAKPKENLKFIKNSYPVKLYAVKWIARNPTMPL